MESNVNTRQALTEKDVIRTITFLLAHCNSDVENKRTLLATDLLKKTQALFDHLIEVTTEGGGVIATLNYKPLHARKV